MKLTGRFVEDDWRKGVVFSSTERESEDTNEESLSRQIERDTKRKTPKTLPVENK